MLNRFSTVLILLSFSLSLHGHTFDINQIALPLKFSMLKKHTILSSKKFSRSFSGKIFFRSVSQKEKQPLPSDKYPFYLNNTKKGIEFYSLLGVNINNYGYHIQVLTIPEGEDVTVDNILYKASRVQILKTITPQELNALHKNVLDKKNRDLSRINFRKAQLQYTDLSNVDLSGLDFSYANFNNAILSYANFSRANLSRISARSTLFVETNLSHTKFNGSSIRRTNFKRANLYKAKFFCTYIDITTFLDADLKMANFSWAIIDRTKFNRANIFGAIFWGVESLDPVSFETTRFKKDAWFLNFRKTP